MNPHPLESRIFQDLRERLVDQTRRNRLLHFKHTAKGSMLRFVDEVPDLVLAHLQNEGRFRFKALPDPEDEPHDERTSEFRAALSKARVTDEAHLAAIAAFDPEDPSAAAKEQKIERDLRDRVRAQLGLPPRPTRRSLDLNAHALRYGVNPAYDLAIPKIEAKHKDEWLQTLLFHDQLKARAASLARKAREVEQETGVGTLHLALGFLEWFENDASEAAFSSPLLLLPVGLEKVKAKRGEEEYHLTALDDVPTTNLSLELRFKKDLGISLPTFASGQKPIEAYLSEVAVATKTLKRSRTRRYLTLAPFSFARIAMYRDLDPVNWTGLPGGGAAAHPLVRPLLRGTAEDSSGNSFAGEYEIDDPEIEKIAPVLISDADSSQHSAIVDVMKGQNLVVEGPPGTGKSQTIANLIANALYRGHRVLFVSEKMAALDVVKSRLDKAGLGHFCLPLHAAGAKPAAVIEALKKRAALQAPRVPANVTAAHSELVRARDALKAHLDALHAEAGPLGETVHTYIGRLVDLTRQLPSLPPLLRGRVIGLPPTIEHRHASEARELLEALETASRAAEVLGINVFGNPFRVLDRSDLFPDEREALLRGLEELVRACQRQYAAAGDLRQGLNKSSSGASVLAISDMVREVDAIKDPPPETDRAYLGTLRSVEEVENALWAATQAEENERAASALRRVGVEEPAGLRINAVKAAIEFAGPLGVNGLTVNQVFQRAQELADQEAAWSAPSETLTSLCRLLRLPADPEAETILLACRATELAARADADWHGYCAPELERHTGILLSGAERQQSLRIRLREIEARLDIGGVSHAALRATASTLQQAGFFSIFRSNVREARTIFVQRWRGGPRPKKDEWAKELNAAAEALAEQAALEHDAALRGLVSAHGSPSQAPLQKLACASKWLAAVTDALATERAEAELVLVALKGLSTDDVMRLAALVGSARDLQRFMEQQSPTPNTRWSSLRSRTATRASALATLADGLRATGLRGDLVLSSFSGIANAYEEWRASRDALASERARAARANAPADLTVLRSSATFAKGIIDRYGALGLFYLEDGWSGRIASLRTYAAAASTAAEETAEVLKRLAEVGLRRFAAEARGRDVQALQAEALEMLAAGAGLPSYLGVAMARTACLENPLSAAVLAAFEEGHERLHHLPEALEWLIAWSLVKRHADAKRAIFTRTGDQLSGFRQSFSENDRARIALDAKLVQTAVINRPVPRGIASGSKSTWTDSRLLDNEFGKQRRHVPVRDLLNRAGAAVTTLAPCLMMSPLTVAQYLKPGGLTFDLVVMDEASQIKPEDAIGAMLRGKQTVIVGDPKQLPPTNFFDRAIGEGEEDEGTIEDGSTALSKDDRVVAESVLDLALRAFRPARRLRWHYRSQHESLIAFSNKAFYENNLVVFPSAHAPSETLGIEMVRVNGIWRERINEEEAKAVASAAADFMRRHPGLSLGIVAMNQPQRDLIRGEIDVLVASDSRLAEYMEKWEEALEEPFVKNLENVQGDERDVIYISLGWGRTPQGALHQRFYPINRRDDGHRRLNVLFTRAKRKIVLFSSLQAEDILVSEASAPGVRVLRDYLAYARDGRLERGNFGDEEADSPFETSVAGALRALGHNVALQVGVAGYRIDLAVRHPEEAERFVLGIECDGATYHRAKSARDRDRLRQEALERLGWKLARVWSTDWFRDPVGQTERLSHEIRVALAQSPVVVKPRRRLVEEAEETTQSPDGRSEPRRASTHAAELAPTASANPPEAALHQGDIVSGTAGRATTLKQALVAFRDGVILRDFPGSEPGRCILRDAMIELIIRTGLDDPKDFHSKIPEFLRIRTDGRQVVYLGQICKFVEEYSELLADLTEAPAALTQAGAPPLVLRGAPFPEPSPTQTLAVVPTAMPQTEHAAPVVSGTFEVGGVTVIFNEAFAAARSIGHEYNRVETLNEIALAQARAGLFAEALATTRSIDDAYYRAETLNEIALTQVRAGFLPEALAVAADALAAAHSIDDVKTRAQAVAPKTFAKVQAYAGLFAEALATARSIDDAYYRAETLNEVGLAQANTGLFAEALATARSIDDTYDPAELLGEIALAQAKTGLLAEALATARSIDDEETRAQVLSAIAAAECDPAIFAEALATARSIRHVETPARVLSTIAVAQAGAGLLAESLVSARSIGYSYDRAIALSAIAEVQRDPAIFAEALASAQSISLPFARAKTLRKICEAQACAGLLAEALVTARYIGHMETRTRALIAIAEAQPRAGLIEEALATARSIDDVMTRAQALSAIAESQRDREIFAEALAAAQSNNLQFARPVKTLREISEAQARAGLLADALATARCIDHMETRARALSAIAEAQSNLRYLLK